MTFTEGAKTIDTQELLDIMKEECTNPTVERLMFLEARKEGEQSGKIFPCYAKAWSSPDTVLNPNPEYDFLIDILQSTQGKFGMVEVVISSKELGVKKRLWNKPPTKALRDETPWVTVEGGVQ